MTAFDAADVATLDQQLAAQGSKRGAAEVTALLRGILAAPTDVDPQRWQLLFEGETPAALQVIGDLKQRLEAAASPETIPVADRLVALRVEMKKAGIDGFFIPRADEFQGEYVPACAERLAWISGFHGSAGSAIILADQAAFFTDGRYTIQTLAEVDGKHFKRYSTAENQAPLITMTPVEWLKTHLRPGQVFGIHGWVHTPADVARLAEAVTAAGATLKILDTNPLDAAWGSARPPAPLAPVVPHDLAYAGIASAEKRQNLGRILQEAHCQMLAVTLPEDICWLLNVRGGDVPCTPFALSYLLAYADGRAAWFIETRKVPQATRDWVGTDVTIHPLDDFLPAVLTAATAGTLWLDPASAPGALEAALMAQGATLHRARTPLALLKACKNSAEVKGTRAAHLRDGASVTRFLAALAAPGIVAQHDEITAAELLLSYRRHNPLLRGLSFDTISGAGGNGAIVHYRASTATSKPLEAGPIYLVDSGAQYLDGTTDITRTIAVGPVDAEMRDHYTRVLKGHVQVAMSLFPAGTTGHILDAKARLPLQEIGLDYAHGTGHGVGSYLSVHEGPCGLSPRNTNVPLMPGMILSNEPGYYKENAYGIRIENLLLVIDTGKQDDQGRKLLAFETLTLAPYDRALIEASLLDDVERTWIDAYHARVRTALLPLLEQDDAQAAAYLETATAPL